MAKRTGVKLGLKNLGIESGGEATGLEAIFGLDSPTESATPRRNRRSKGNQDDANTSLTFGEIDILNARPDPDQPRTLLPIAAYRAMDAGDDPQDVLLDWFDTQSTASPAQQEEMNEIKALADTIQTAGLQQPIGIREVSSSQSEVQYAVVFGERRWWAHVYLLSADNNALGQTTGKIKAGLVQPDNIQLVQLIENLHRRNLPPLDLAMGLQTSYDQLKASGVKAPWQQIEKATGIGRAQRSRYLHLLELAPSVQQKIRDHGLTENAVRKIADKLRKEPEEVQLIAINKIITPPQRAPRNEKVGFSKIASQVMSKMRASTKTLGKIDSATADKLRIYLNDDIKQAQTLVTLRNQLNQLLNDVVPGHVYLVQTAEGWLELNAENNPAGYLAFESYLEAAAEGGEVVEYRLEDAQSLATTAGMVLWIAKTNGEITG